jgi:ArsR family transcriptional regulator
MTDSRATTQGLAPEPEALSRYFRVLGDPTRLRIIEALLDQERTVSDLVEILQVPRSRISNHLACLGWCRFVTSERQGRSVVYRTTEKRISRILDLAASLAEPNCDHLMSCSRIGPDWI